MRFGKSSERSGEAARGLDCLSIFFFKKEEEGSRSFWVWV